jgi:hypothetical protein
LAWQATSPINLDQAPTPPSSEAVQVLARSEGSATISVPGATADQAARRIGEHFHLNGYRLEAGHPERGSYGKGSAYGRLVWGALTERYKFDLQVGANELGATVVVAMGMSGVSGGTIGRSKMSSEFERMVASLCQALRQSDTRQSVLPSGLGVAAEIDQLSRLRDRGVLTQAEFESAKARTLEGQGISGVLPGSATWQAPAPDESNPYGSLPSSDFPTIPSRADSAAVSFERVIRVPCPVAVAWPIIRDYMSSVQWVSYSGLAPGLVESRWLGSSGGSEWLTARVRSMEPIAPNHTEIQLTAWSEKYFSGFGLVPAVGRRATNRVLANHLDRFEVAVLPRLR